MATRSMIAAVSAIAAEQTYLQETGSNIANSNTVGYKQGEVQFADLLSQQVAGATAPTAGSAGVNPLAIGSGVRVASVSTDLSEGTLVTTGIQTDVAITGGGYLVVEQGGQQYYTRDGSLTVDASGQLATVTGAKVLGWQASVTGKIASAAAVTPITIPTGKTIGAIPTTSIQISGNLPAWNGGTSTPPSVTVSAIAYDSLGSAVPVLLTFKGATTANEWTFTAKAKTPVHGTTLKLFTSPQTVTFSKSGNLTKVNATTVSASGVTLPVTTKPTGFTTLVLHFPSTTSNSALTQFAGSQSVTLTQNGSAPGTLVSYSIGSNGVITGTFSNGKTMALAQIALASFANPSGLVNVGNNLLGPSANSGQPSVGTPGTAGRGNLLSGQLEQSNVTLAQQLTNLITAQQAYVADTKVISTSQSMMNSLEQA
ncbi:MAG: flagellar hook protein FlgE [Acidimicrobiales bacterium]